MAKKAASDKPVAKKPLKKVRSFNIDDRIYNGLMDIFERSGAQVTLSVLVDEFLRKLYVYLLEAESLIEKRGSDIPLSRIIYDCMDIEYFWESNKKNTRLRNFMWSHEASKQGMSLSEWMAQFPPGEFDE